MLSLLQTGMKPREARQEVMIPSRMRLEADWVDVCIHNLSSRGLLVAAEVPPAPGSYVDIRRGSRTIIGRVVWRKGRFFGVKTQDRLDLDGLINEPRLAGRPHKNSTRLELTSDRRAGDRMAEDAAIARRLERSRQLSSAFQFGLIVAGGAAIAGLLATGVYDVLARPFATVAAKLSPEA